MKKKRIISIPLALALSLVTVVAVLAGTTSDIGTLQNDPPAGSANWTAWAYELNFNVFPPTQIYPPTQVLTEDNSNAAAGENLGYTDAGWFIQVENLQTASNGFPIYVSFGGLLGYKGSHWYKTFNWDGTSVSETNHGEVPITTLEGPACPTIYPVITHSDELYNEVRFWGSPNTTYHVYRSTSPSAAGNGASNGRYRLQGPALTDATGMGVYEDHTDGITNVTAWYLIIYFGNSPTLGNQGCHSEPTGPTATVLSSFTSSFDLETTSVKLSWETVSDSSILGFNIYRSDEITPDPVKINPEMVLVYEPGAMEGNQYSYTDADVEFGQTYTYWIDVVDLEALTSRYGPVTQTAGFKVFVPILQR